MQRKLVVLSYLEVPEEITTPYRHLYELRVFDLSNEEEYKKYTNATTIEDSTKQRGYYLDFRTAPATADTKLWSDNP